MNDDNKGGSWDAAGRVIEKLQTPVKKSSMKYMRAKKDLDELNATGFTGMDTPENREKWLLKKNALQRIVNSAE